MFFFCGFETFGSSNLLMCSLLEGGLLGGQKRTEAKRCVYMCVCARRQNDVCVCVYVCMRWPRVPFHTCFLEDVGTEGRLTHVFTGIFGPGDHFIYVFTSILAPGAILYVFLRALWPRASCYPCFYMRFGPGSSFR